MDRGRRTVKLYGLIYFQCKDGFLAASGLEGERLFLRAPAVVGETADEVLPFFGFADACVFRVVPTLSSQAAALSVKSASGAARTHARGGGAAAGAGTAGSGGEAALSDAYAAYDPRSAADIIDVEEITYGKSFSLVHEASGLFLSVAHALPSENDPDCLSVVLVQPSAAQTPSCELTLVSRYKIHADGDKLCRADSVLIRLAGHPMFLHVSAPPIMEAVANNVGDTELLHRTFRLGSSLPFMQRGQSGPAGNGAGTAAENVAANAAAAASAEGAAATVAGMVHAPSSFSLGGSFALPASAAAAMVAPQRCSTDVAVEALTREYLDEVNACEEGGVTFTLHRYDVGTDRANRQRAQLRLTRPYVACGVPVALFHRERESFLMTSATQPSRDGAAALSAHEHGGAARADADDHVGSPAAPGPSMQRPPAATADALDVGSEDGLGTLALPSRQPRASLAGVTAATGASGAIRRTAAATSGVASLSAAGSPMDDASVVSYTTVLQRRERQQRERALRTNGLIDTGDGRRFPFPVFAATVRESAGGGAGHRGGSGGVRGGGGGVGGSAAMAAGTDVATAESHAHCTTLWAFEHEEPSLGGPVRLGGAWRYRIRHVVSGMYVAVCGSAVDAMLADFSDGDRASSKEGSEVAGAAPASAGIVPHSPANPTCSSSSSSSPVTYASSTSSSSSPSSNVPSGAAREPVATPAAPAAAGATAAESEHLAVPFPAAAATATARATRETQLCLIPSPRTRQELAASLFSVEPIYATDSVYLIEQSCLALRNVLTEMYVVTESGVDGSDVALSLDWQPSTADPVIVSYVPHQLQLDARFVAGQCAWLARFRAEMQALVRAQRHARSVVEAAAAHGDTTAAAHLAAERAYLDGLPAQLKPLYKVADPDVELLQRRERMLGGQTSLPAAPSSGSSPRGRDWTAPLETTYASNAKSHNASHRNSGGSGLGGSFAKEARHLSATGGSGAAAAAVEVGERAVPGVRSGTETAPPYAAMRHTIRLCQRALIALLTFCTESDESNVLRREGLPIPARQALFHEMRFHRLLFDVVQAPFALLDAVGGDVSDVYRAAAANNIAALMRSDVGTFDEVFDQLRLAQQQQADMSCVWSGMWHSSSSSSGAAVGGGGGCDAYREAVLDRRCGGGSRGAAVEGIMDEKEIMLPMHRELHLLLRLALRLLRQLVKGDAATYARGWSAYIPALLRLDGLRLHVVDTMQELFTDNPHIPVRAVRQVSEHFIHVAREIRRGAYMDFLGAACTIKYRGVPERQAFVCQKLLVENPQSLCRFVVVVPPGKSAATDGVVYILPSEKADVGTDSESDAAVGASENRSRPPSSSPPPPPPPPPPGGTLSAPPPGYVRFTDFFRSCKDKKQVAFVQNQIALFARLCYDGCPDECRRVVQQLFPAAAMQSVLETFAWTGEQVVGRRCAHDELRSHLIRLATQCFVLPRIAVPAVQLRVSTVLFGSSQLRQRDSPMYSGLPDDSMTSALKTVIKSLLRANPFFVQDDTGRSVLMRAAVSMWLKLTRYRQYSHAEALEVLPLLMQLLDGTRDVVDGRVLQQRQRRRQSSRPRSPQPSSASSASSGGDDNSGGLGGATWASGSGDAVDAAGGGHGSGWSSETSSGSSGGGGGGSSSGRRGASRLVHKEESVHLMRVREMVCQALFLLLQHEVFRAADSVIVTLHDAYTAARQRDPSAADGAGEGRGVLRGVLSAAAEAVRVPLTAPFGTLRTGSACETELSPLLPSHAPPPPASSSVSWTAGSAERDARTALALRRRADGYAELPDDAELAASPLSRTAGVGAPLNAPASASASAVYSASWTSQHMGDRLDSPFAALSSSDSSSDSDVEGAEGARGVTGRNTQQLQQQKQPSVRGGRGRCRQQRGGAAGVSAAEVQACLDYHTSCIAAYFTPARLVPCLFDLTRYDCSPLTVQAMNLLVQLCVIKRSIAQLVLKVNTLPSVEVLRGFDKMFDVAVQLREAQECATAVMAEPAERAARWTSAVAAALHALRGPSPAAAGLPGDDAAAAEAAAAAPAVEAGAHTRRTAHLRQMYDSMRGGSAEELLAHSFAEEEAEEDVDDDDENEQEAEQDNSADASFAATTSAASAAGRNASMAEGEAGAGAEDVAALSASLRQRRRQQRVNTLWSKTSGAVRMLVYNTTIRNRRRAMGLSETSTIPLNVVIRAEMMAHWKVHESVLAMLPSLDPASESFRMALQFFYLFTFSESNSLLLQPYVSLFLDKLCPRDKSATVCLHVIVRILRCTTNVEDYLTQPLLEAFVGHVKEELYTKLPDPELVNMLSQYIFSKSSVSPVVRRRMMILFREHGTLSSLSRVRLSPTLAEVLFMSGLVNLICGICGSHTSVLTLARSMLPAEQICTVILQRRIVQSLPSALMEVSHSAQRASESLEQWATPNSVAALKLLNPYIRLLVALYFIPNNDSDVDSRRRCLLWMGNAQLWGIARLFTQALNTVSDAMERDDGCGGGGGGGSSSGAPARVVNRGVVAVRVYHTLLCSTIPVAVAAFFMNCFSNEAYVRFQKEVIGRAFTDLSASCARFGALLMQHNGALGLTVEEVVNHRRALGTLRYRLQKLDDPNPTANVAGLVELCEATKQRMRVWLAAQQREVELAVLHADAGSSAEEGPPSPTATPSRTTHVAAAHAFVRHARAGGRLQDNEDDIGAFRLLFAEEAVSTAQLRSQEALEVAGFAGAAGPRGGASADAMETDTNALHSVGLLLPGVLSSDRGVAAVRASLRSTLRGDSIVPSLRRGPSEAAMIATRHLLRCAGDEAMQEAVSCIVEAMREHLFRPRTFVGVLNLFANALDAALHYPQLVNALATSTTSTSTSPTSSSVGAAAAASRDADASPSFASPTLDGDSASGYNPDAAVPLESLGYAMQTAFNDAGMLSVVISLCGLEEDVTSLNAIRLGVLILEGGNRQAQSRLLNFFVTREEGFFYNVRDILRKNLTWVAKTNAEHQFYLMKRGMRTGQSKSAVAAANIQLVTALNPPQHATAFASAVDANLEVFTASRSYVAALHGSGGSAQRWRTTVASGAAQVSGWARVRGSRRLKLVTFLFRLLQLFCEGHYAGLQNYIRAQYDNLHSVNIVHEAMVFMEEVSTFVTPSNFRVLLQGFEFLTEVCQGPCRLNQQSLIDYGACRVIRHVVEYLQDQSEDRRTPASAAAAQSRVQPGSVAGTPSTDAALGVCGVDVMNALHGSDADRLRVSVSNTLLALLEGCREADAYRRVLRQIPLTTVALEVQYALHPSTLHYIVHDEDQFEENDRVAAMFNWVIYLWSVQPYAAMEGVAAGVAALLRSSESVSRYLGSIEIRRADGLERVYFRVPIICTSLTQERKNEVLWTVDRTSRATKLADFLHKSDELIFAVEWNHAFHRKLRAWTRYTVPYVDASAHGGGLGLVQRSVRACKVFHNNYVAAALVPYELSRYDTVSMVLAVLTNTILIAMEGGSSGEAAAAAKASGRRARAQGAVPSYGNTTVSVLCVLQTIVCAFLCLVYIAVLFPVRLYSVYKTKQRVGAAKLRLNVALAEAYAGLTARERLRAFVTWFDMQFRLLLFVFAVLSCTVSHYFAAFNLMLLVYSIPTLRTFIAAITMNGRQLLLTSFMGVIMLYLFSIVGFLLFQNQYNADGDGDDGDAAAGAMTNCETLLQCFAYILDQGLRAGGGVGDVMQPWAWGTPRMMLRLAYDMLFYALVTVVFLNILFGIIIDTFGQMRDEKREKEADMHGLCFICGLDADTLEKGSSKGFAHHVKAEHNMWMYLNFMHHLRRKDPSDYTGQESYVSGYIQRGSLGFFPEEDCIALMEQQQESAAAAQAAAALGEDDEEGGTTEADTDAATGAAAASARAAMKELTLARETVNAYVKEWQGDLLRLKAVLQQLELASRSAGAGAVTTGTGACDGRTDRTRHTSNSLDHNSGGGPGERGRRGAPPRHRTARAETRTPPRSHFTAPASTSSAEAYALPPSLADGGGGGAGGGGGSTNGGSSVHRALQAQLEAERQWRQRAEAERQHLQELLQDREAALRRASRPSS